ncbi:MAG: hypothetical protein MI739_14870 [Bacteroidales bacterium]|nr:hypothetical protein [Bacteroidales bacterium]
MKKFIIVFLNTVLLSLIFQTVSAQELKEFAQDTAVFIDQFEKFMDRNITEIEEDSLEAFVDEWENGYFSKSVMNRFITICNFLLSNKANRNPHFRKYLDLVMVFHSSEKAMKHYDNWEKGIFYIFESQKHPLGALTNYFKHIKTLLVDEALYKTYSTSWYINTNNYEIITNGVLKIKFPKTDLTCKIKKDSINIFETSGDYYILSDTWKGKEGTVTWERAGYPKEDINAQLSNYEIDLKRSGYSADSVTFINKIYFKEPAKGVLTDHVVNIIKPDRAIYPEFSSYKKRFFVEDIYPNINYDGGFSMKGSKLLGSGDKDNPAYIHIIKEDTTILTAKSKLFVFRKKRVISNNTQVTLFMRNDSIYHPGIAFDYTIKTKEISLHPSDRIVSKSPYFDSYHNITMNFDRLLWRTDEDKIYLTKKRGAAIGNGVFTSSNFYNLQEFERIMMQDDFHPLIAIKHFCKKINSENFSGVELAHHLGYDDYQIKQMLMFLSIDGFIFYDTDEDQAITKKKLYDFIDARFGKIDFDVINFNSVTRELKHNGVIDLSNFDLEINGIPSIFLSDSQQVAIYPRQNSITMKKNRDFTFDGTINAGLFNFYGDNFYFSYDTFKINMFNIDSLTIKVATDEYDMYNNPILEHIQNSIQTITGNLLIDKPHNKSGRESLSEYPIFNSDQNSFVYYDSDDIFNGVYERDNFFFELDPFVIDSLDNFTTKGLSFDGEFTSAGIFPPFRDKISVQDDYSMGFKRSTPPEGFPLYDGKGTYENYIHLSNQGLKGSGTLHYLTSSAQTDSVLFFPDSTIIHAKNYTMQKTTTGIEYPHIVATDIDIEWYPKKDIMHAKQTEAPFEFFDNNSHLSGDLVLKPTGLTAWGVMDLEKAELSSNHFEIKSHSFSTDTTTFKLKTLKKDDFTFTTDNLKGEVDFFKNEGDFKSNEDFTIAEFKKNLYLTYMDQFKWDIANDEIDIESSPKVNPNTTSEKVREFINLKDDDFPGALYMSTHKAQDSIRFISTHATYALRDSTIRAHEVEYIRVADAFIYPDKKDVEVATLAKINTLYNSTVIANTQTKLHKIYNAKINIRGRYDYFGSGDYDYVDENKDVQVIHFTDISVDSVVHTIAKSKIDPNEDFTLSPVYHYKGDVTLNASHEFLTFKGGVKIDHDCPRNGVYFAQFNTDINPNDIYIPIDSSTNSMSGLNLFAASFITKDSSHIYSRFLERRRDPNDEALVRATGHLYFDKKANKYTIAQKSKHRDIDTVGSLVSLQRDLCLQHSEGKVNLGIELGQVKLSPAGSVNHMLEPNEVKLELVLPLDFFFSGVALDSLINDIRSNQDLSEMNMSSRFFKKNMTELVGFPVYNKFNNQILLYGDKATVPEPTRHTFLLGNVKLQWHTSMGMYLNYHKIGIATINNKPVNRYVDGYMQIIKRRSGDLFKFYIKLPNKNYYYFSYSRGVMQVLSNNDGFMAVIKKLKKRNRKLKTLRKETPYRYIIATDQNLAQFLRKIKLFEEGQMDELQEQEKDSDELEKSESIRNLFRNLF